jgi:hypothetical protein
MSGRLNTQLKKFHENIRLDNESEVLCEKRKILQNDFEKNFPQKMKDLGCTIKKSDLTFFDQGSYRQNSRTVIKSDNVDRDIAVEFPLDIEDFDDPRKIKKKAKVSLERINRVPKIKEPCITVGYSKAGEETIHIDFPLYAIHNDCHYLARGKEFSNEYSWEKCDPRGLNYLFDSWFADTEGDQFRRIIRYLKRWKNIVYGNSITKDALPPGIAITLTAHKGFYEKPDDDLEALSQVVNTMLDCFTINSEGKYSIKENLPVEPYTDVFFKMSEINQDSYYYKLEKLKEALSFALSVTEEYEAAKKLQKFFGDDFPLPDPPIKKHGRNKKENSHG